jgi:uncharacterized protein (TIGR02284 family)
MADINNHEHIDHEKVIDVVENLIETCRDGQKGFLQAAENVKDPQLRAFFNEHSLERGQFAGDLENEVIHLGKHDPEREGTASAAVHRGWIDLKAALGAGDAAILSSVESGEDNAKKQYDEALQEKLPVNIRGIIERQAQRVRAVHDQVRDMRDKKKAA